mmetsp:Transcript_25932/g.60243  ORF Transcript_25932/g.60243 Transcript_25932/m.60243 type:complete len:215 (-) Transcript_25932:143-787(-)
MEQSMLIALQMSTSGPLGSLSINTSSCCAMDATSPALEKTAAYKFHRAALASSLSRSCHHSLSLLLTSSSDMSILRPLLLSRYFFWGFPSPSSSGDAPFIVVNLRSRLSLLVELCFFSLSTEKLCVLNVPILSLLPIAGADFFEGESTALRRSSLDSFLPFDSDDFLPKESSAVLTKVSSDIKSRASELLISTKLLLETFPLLSLIEPDPVGSG